jgi:hypothetical protein
LITQGAIIASALSPAMKGEGRPGNDPGDRFSPERLGRHWFKANRERPAG